MKKCDFKSIHSEFDDWIYWYAQILKKIIEAERIIKTQLEKEELVEAIVFRAAVRWELLIERDIISSINKDSSVYSSALNLRLRKHLTKDECKAMIIGHRFLDFKSVGDVKSFGKRFLHSEVNPFAAITGAQASKVDEFMTIRNLLAHYSDYAWRSYYGFMRTKYKYVHVPEPGKFLMSILADGKYRWAEYILNFLDVSKTMANSLKIK